MAEMLIVRQHHLVICIGFRTHVYWKPFCNDSRLGSSCAFKMIADCQLLVLTDDGGTMLFGDAMESPKLHVATYFYLGHRVMR